MEELRYNGKSVNHSVSCKYNIRQLLRRQLLEPILKTKQVFLVFQLPKQFESFCEDLEDPVVSSLQELIEFNNKNATLAMPERMPISLTFLV